MRTLRTLLVALALAVSARASAQVISIAAARSLPAGTVVTVEGSVRIPSGGARITAVGSSGQFLSQYEALPRHRGDIHRATP